MHGKRAFPFGVGPLCLQHSGGKSAELPPLLAGRPLRPASRAISQSDTARAGASRTTGQPPRRAEGQHHRHGVLQALGRVDDRSARCSLGARRGPAPSSAVVVVAPHEQQSPALKRNFFALNRFAARTALAGEPR